MRIKNAFKILISNSSVIYKSIFFKLITSVIICLIGYFIIEKDIKHIFYTEEVHNFWNAILNTLTGFIKGDGLDTESLPITFNALLAMLARNASSIFWALLKIAIFVFLLNMVERIGNFAIGILTNSFMSSLSKYSMIASLIPNLGKAALYSLIITPIAMIFDGVVLFLSVLIAVYGLRYISILAIIISVMFMVFALSIKFTMHARFLPSVITENLSVGKAFLNCFKKRDQFLKMVGNHAFVIMISFYLNVSVAVFTLGVGLLVSVPLTSVFFVLIAFVDHYQLSGKKYFVSAEEVVSPRQLHKHADLLKYM